MNTLAIRKVGLATLRNDRGHLARRPNAARRLRAMALRRLHAARRCFLLHLRRQSAAPR